MMRVCIHCESDFDDQSRAKREARESYSRAWKAVTGFHKGKSCHLSGSNTTIGNRPMRHVAYNAGNANHKGKA